jgi:hypothetical protein
MFRYRKMVEKQVFFWTLSGVVKPSRSIGVGCQVSGRFSLFLLLTPDTCNLSASVQILRKHSYFSKLNAEVGRFSLAEFHIHKMKEG